MRLRGFHCFFETVLSLRVRMGVIGDLPGREHEDGHPMVGLHQRHTQWGARAGRKDVLVQQG